jgi:hypothetical protein
VGELVRDAGELRQVEYAVFGDGAEQLTQMLGFPLARVKKVKRTRKGDHGKTTAVEMDVVQPAWWSFHSAAVMLDIAAKVGALPIGEATERQAMIVEGLTLKDLSDMSLNQLLALRAQLERGRH